MVVAELRQRGASPAMRMSATNQYALDEGWGSGSKVDWTCDHVGAAGAAGSAGAPGESGATRADGAASAAGAAGTAHA